MKESKETLSTGYPGSTDGGKAQEHERHAGLQQFGMSCDEFAQLIRQTDLADCHAEAVGRDDDAHNVGEAIAGTIEELLDTVLGFRRGDQNRHDDSRHHCEADEPAVACQVAFAVFREDNPFKANGRR